MPRLSWTPAVLLAILSCAAAQHSGPTPAQAAVATVDAAPTRREMVRRILPHNVRIYVYEGKGIKRSASGVVVANETTDEGPVSYVVTNAHAVDATKLSKPRWEVVVEQGPDVIRYGAQVLAMGQVPQLDLALVKVKGVRLSPAELAGDSELELGDDVLVVAAPYGKAISLSGGMVSQIEWETDTRKPQMLKTDAPIGYGASGGGIYSLSSGKLLAIVEGYRTAKVGFAVAEQTYSFDVPMPGETFAAPTAKVRSFLEDKGFAQLLGAPHGMASERTQAAVR
jgi:serine protease Do